ncbi:MAG: VWA domain-containing protein [Mobilitalea sp.]
MYCSRCGTKLEKKVTVCPNCGNITQQPSSGQQNVFQRQNNEQDQTSAGQKPFSKKLKLLLPIVIVLAILGVIFGYKYIDEKNEYREIMNMANVYLEDNNYEKALEYYHAVLIKKPNYEAALNKINEIQTLQLANCVDTIQEYLSYGDYDQALLALQGLGIKKSDLIYEKYQKIYSFVVLRPERAYIDTEQFPTVHVILQFNGNPDLTEDAYSIYENSEKCEIISSEFKLGQATFTYTAKAAEHSSGFRDVEINISSEDLVLYVNSEYETPVLGLANITLINTDISNYPIVKTFFRINDVDTGERINNLTADAFTINESIDEEDYFKRDVLDVTSVEENEGVSIEFVIDKGYNVGNSNLGKIKSALTEFVQTLNYDQGDKAEILAFDTVVQQMCAFTNDPSLLINGINQMYNNGTTAFYDAVYEGINHAAAQEGAKCLIAITGGYDYESYYSYLDVIDYANLNQVSLYIISSGEVDTSALQEIAAYTNGVYWNLEDWNEMTEIINTIYELQKELYVVQYKSDASKDMYLKRDLQVEILAEGYAGDGYPSFRPRVTIRNDEANGQNSRYKLFVEDISWEMASQKCQDMGGHLVTITSQAEMDEVIALAEQSDANYIWMGGNTSYGEYGKIIGHWITGEEFSYSAWGVEEPSRVDFIDGADERYLMLWNVPSLGGWSWNDQRNDPLADYTYLSGEFAYICEFE